jgi:hypothetical protein
MSYGLKYILHYETERYGTDIRVLISEKDYTGASAPKKIGAGRIQLSMDKDGQVKGSTLDFSIQADTDMEFANFFTLDNKAHKVELEFNHGIVWTGYIVSDQYSEPFIAPPYDVQVMATDGLGLLKNEKFELSGMVSRFEAIRYCIDKIGIAYPYAININIWEERMNITGHNMLDQLYFQAEILSGKTCYEAIQAILPENCFINQANGHWMIERPTDRTLPRYVFNADGTPSQETYNWHTFLRNLGTVAQAESDHSRLYPIGNLMLEMQSAWRKFTIKQNYGKRDSFFRNADFTKGTSNWTPTGSFLSIKNMTDIGDFAVLDSAGTMTADHISQSIPVKASLSAITFAINYATVGYVFDPNLTPAEEYTANNTIEQDLRFQLSLFSEGVTYYLDQNGWSQTEKFIKISQTTSAPSFSAINFQEFKIVASQLPGNGILTVKIYTVQEVLFGDGGYSFNYLCVKSVQYFDNQITAYPTSEETTVVLNENTSESEKTIELMPVDLPDFENANLYFDNGNYVEIGGEYLSANKWGSTSVRYLEYMSAYMAYLYQSPKQVLKGEISGWLELNSYIYHALSDKIFMIDKGTWNVLEHTFTLDLIELPEGEFSFDDYQQTLPEPFTPSIDTTDIPANQIKTIDGSFEVPLPNTSTPLIVARKRTIDPHKMDFDSGTPQFSIQDAVVETNVGDLQNSVHIDAGKIINHHYSSLDRTSIGFIKDSTNDYNPTREWAINATDIILPDNDGYFLYVKVPLAE